jgi:zinc transporter ZupT
VKADPEVVAPAADPTPSPAAARWLFGIGPLVLLTLVILALITLDPLASFRGDVPPVEEVTVTRTILHEDPSQIVLHVRNGGPDPVTIAQVLVDDAYWNHDVTPSRRLGRLDEARITIPYPWVEGETHHLLLLSETGVPFEHEIGVAVASPERGPATFGSLALVGLLVGLVPVVVGLLWFPFVRRLRPVWVNFFLALTVGLLVFLAADAIHEALELSADVPPAFQGVGLVVVGVVVALVALFALDGMLRRRRGGVTPLAVAFLIAAGIGLHNFGEGLAIGAAHALGEIGLGTFLIVGFALHNVTEGLGIVTPLARSRVHVGHLLGLGAVAGLPTVLGAWGGGFAYSPTMAVLFLSVGAGAIIQVVWEVAKLIRRDASLTAPAPALGFLAGVLVMYTTGLFVAA